MKVEEVTAGIKALGIEYLIGVPDSTLRQFCDYIQSEGRDEFCHFVTPNEGAAVGMATGVYLSTGHPACVYMQNSGIGNIVNPVTSLANEEVYGIPMLFIVGWRGEPGFHDEPQHKFMGRVTKEMLELLEISYSVIGNTTSSDELKQIFKEASKTLSEGKQYAVIVRKDAFEAGKSIKYQNGHSLIREEVIEEILHCIHKTDIVVSTTGKISREVYEQSDKILGQHAQEFLTVGGMGHASMIALAIAKTTPSEKVFCIDGDGAVLMHMGALAFIGREHPENMIHICLNNEAHESVGGMPTGAAGQSYADIAQQCGYRQVHRIETKEELKTVFQGMREMKGPVFIEIMVAMDSRKDLGRPKETATENKNAFMRYHEVR